MVTKTLKRQVNQIFRTLVEALSNAPDSEFPLPADNLSESIGGLAMHIAGSIESAFPSDKLFEKWKTPVANREQCIEYIQDCKKLVLLPYIENHELLEPDESPEYFVSKLDRVLKITRHIAQHTGEINSRLKSKGLQAAKFI